MKERLLPLLLLSADAVRYKFASKNSIIPALSTLHSRPTFTAGSSSFAIILRTCWRVVLSRASDSTDHSSPQFMPSYSYVSDFISKITIETHANSIEKAWVSQFTEQISILQSLIYPSMSQAECRVFQTACAQCAAGFRTARCFSQPVHNICSRTAF